MLNQNDFYAESLEESKIKMEKYGFVIYRNVIDINLLKSTKSSVIKYLKKNGLRNGTALTQPNAAIYMSFLKEIFSHEGIIEKLKFLIGDNIVFTCHCDAHLGILSNWHKDDGTLGGKSKGYFGEWTYEKSDCLVYKVALYLQDHYRNSGGLSVIPGSHKTSHQDTKGQKITLNTNAGDIIIFDVRLTHSGQKDVIPLNWNKKNVWLQNFLNFLKNIPLIGKVFNSFIKITYNKLFGPKAALFFTYGANNKWTKKFSIENMKRQIYFLKNNNTKLPKKTYDQLRQKEILVFDDFENLI